MFFFVVDCGDCVVEVVVIFLYFFGLVSGYWYVFDLGYEGIFGGGGCRVL